jgi:GNAT superfamily N-acetyltransferase
VITVAVVDPARTRELRRSVLRPHLSPADPLPGDELGEAVHLAALAADGTVLSTCFVFPNACPWRPERPGAWQLRQMATSPGHRGEGHGAAVVAAAMEQVRARGGALVWCHAREQAAGFYARLGFRPHGPVFTDEQHSIPHRSMWRDV